MCDEGLNLVSCCRFWVDDNFRSRKSVNSQVGLRLCCAMEVADACDCAPEGSAASQPGT